MFLGADTLFTKDLRAFIGYFLGLALVFVNPELFPGLRSAVEAQQQYRRRRGCGVDAFVPFIEHGLHTTEILAGNDQVPGIQSAVLYEDGGDIPASFIEGGFDDGSRALALGIGLQVKQFGFQPNFFQ